MYIYIIYTCTYIYIYNVYIYIYYIRIYIIYIYIYLLFFMYFSRFLLVVPKLSNVAQMKSSLCDMIGNGIIPDHVTLAHVKNSTVDLTLVSSLCKYTCLFCGCGYCYC